MNKDIYFLMMEKKDHMLEQPIRRKRCNHNYSPIKLISCCLCHHILMKFMFLESVLNLSAQQQMPSFH